MDRENPEFRMCSVCWDTFPSNLPLTPVGEGIYARLCDDPYCLLVAKRNAGIRAVSLVAGDTLSRVSSNYA